MADLAFLEAKIVCGGAWGNDKMVWGFLGRWWEGAVAHYWCLALGGRGEGRGKWGWGFIWGKNFGGRGFIIGGNVVTLW